MEGRGESHWISRSPKRPPLVEVWSCDEDGHVIVPFLMGSNGARDMDAHEQHMMA